MAMMAITTNSSISVKARRERQRMTASSWEGRGWKNESAGARRAGARQGFSSDQRFIETESQNHEAHDKARGGGVKRKRVKWAIVSDFRVKEKAAGNSSATKFVAKRQRIARI